MDGAGTSDSLRDICVGREKWRKELRGAIQCRALFRIVSETDDGGMLDWIKLHLRYHDKKDAYLVIDNRLVPKYLVSGTDMVCDKAMVLQNSFHVIDLEALLCTLRLFVSGLLECSSSTAELNAWQVFCIDAVKCGVTVEDARIVQTSVATLSSGLCTLWTRNGMMLNVRASLHLQDLRSNYGILVVNLSRKGMKIEQDVCGGTVHVGFAVPDKQRSVSALLNDALYSMRQSCKSDLLFVLEAVVAHISDNGLNAESLGLARSLLESLRR